MPAGINEILYEMEVGTSGTFVIPAEKAYGRHDPNGVQVYPRCLVPGGESCEVGDVGMWNHPVSRMVVPIRCIDATPEAVTIDFNHPLAGKDLAYWFELVAILDD